MVEYNVRVTIQRSIRMLLFHRIEVHDDDTCNTDATFGYLSTCLGNRDVCIVEDFGIDNILFVCLFFLSKMKPFVSSKYHVGCCATQANKNKRNFRVYQSNTSSSYPKTPLQTVRPYGSVMDRDMFESRMI